VGRPQAPLNGVLGFRSVGRRGAVLAAAGSIVEVEARHAALIPLMRDRDPAPLAFDAAPDKETRSTR
jgi:hypothetical protein